VGTIEGDGFWLGLCKFKKKLQKAVKKAAKRKLMA
jgi:hypothetical protein